MFPLREKIFPVREKIFPLREKTFPLREGISIQRKDEALYKLTCTQTAIRIKPFFM